MLHQSIVKISTKVFSKKAYDALMFTLMCEQSDRFTINYILNFKDLDVKPHYSKSSTAFHSYLSLWNCVNEITRNFTDGSIELIVKEPSFMFGRISTPALFKAFAEAPQAEQLKQFTLALRKTLKLLQDMQPEDDEVVITTRGHAAFNLHSFNVRTRIEEDLDRWFGIECRQYVHVVQKSTLRVLIALLSGKPIEKMKKRYGEDLVDEVIGKPLNPFAANHIQTVYEQQDNLAKLGEARLQALVHELNTYNGVFYKNSPAAAKALQIFHDIESQQKALEETIEL